MTIWHMVCSFGTFYGFGVVHQYKSGNPALEFRVSLRNISMEPSAIEQPEAEELSRRTLRSMTTPGTSSKPVSGNLYCYLSVVHTYTGLNRDYLRSQSLRLLNLQLQRQR
jgi:hypothetical protein